MKNEEYQLRVDDQREGGRFSFFVYLDGWEPRVSSIAPRAGQWYHLVARWTGTEAILQVNGQKSSVKRLGTPRPTRHPVMVGKANCRVDELRICNPSLLQMRDMMSRIKAVPEEERIEQRQFGGANGWKGWRGCWGGEMTVHGGTVTARFPDENAAILNPALDIDASNHTYVCIDWRASGTDSACLFFVTDVGSGFAECPAWNVQRTSIVNLASHPSWRGRLKLLGLSFPSGGTHEVIMENLWISDKPEGKPFLYVRNLAPWRAVLRAGRKEKIVAIVRNLGVASGQLQARFVPPRGVRVLDEQTKTVSTIAHNGTQRFEWTVLADEPTKGEAKVLVWAPSFPGSDKTLLLDFKPMPKLPKADYVPPPKPAKPRYLTLMHYCPLWKAGTHWGWEYIEDWPERRPAIGWYDEGTPEVADWHIKYALEHGIQGFIYCWYRADFSPEIHVSLGHALHDGLLKARYLDMFKFAIMWENGCAKGVKSVEDMMQNVLPYWISNYFTHPSYVKIDNKPLLFVWRPERVAPEVGGSEAVRNMFERMRAECKKHGFDGLYIVGCVGDADEGLLTRMASEGWDASSAYGIASPSSSPPTVDFEGIPAEDYRETLEGQIQTLLAKKAVGALPDIVDIMMGWDPRPWHQARTVSYRANPSPQAFKEACLRVRQIIEQTPGNGLDTRVVVFDNWNEFGEGHYIEPCSGFGFGFLDAIREVFCAETEPCVDIVPEDIGLQPPEHVYAARRNVLGVAANKEHKVVDNIVAWWSFDENDEYLALDSSQGGFDGVKDRFEAAEGIQGKGFRCGTGSVSLRAHELLFPTKGITVELWMKAEEPNQSDRWMLNTVSAPNVGYRLGLTSGKVAWQIPYTPWSHLLASPEPVPVGQWVHVVATHDNQTMRLFINAREVGSLERRGAVKPSDGRVCLGAYGPGDPPHAFIGVLDEVRIYDRALSAEEITQRYQKYAK
jgi:hypothetical protein